MLLTIGKCLSSYNDHIMLIPLLVKWISCVQMEWVPKWIEQGGTLMIKVTFEGQDWGLGFGEGNKCSTLINKK